MQNFDWGSIYRGWPMWSALEQRLIGTRKLQRMPARRTSERCDFLCVEEVRVVTGWWRDHNNRAGTVRISVCGRAVDHQAAMALMKRSPKITANCAFAMVHSRGGIFHSFSDRFKIR